MSPKPLAAKDHRYEDIFPMVVSTRDYTTGTLLASDADNDYYCVRECFIREFAHLDEMRKVYTMARLRGEQHNLKFYEVLVVNRELPCVQTPKTTN